MIRRILVVATIATALSVVAVGPAAALNPAGDDQHDLARAAVIDRVILAIMEHYYDPARIDAHDMFVATLDSLQDQVAEIKYKVSKNESSAAVHVRDRLLELDISEVHSPWELSRALRRVLRHVADHVSPKDYNFMEIEYNLANAVLSTLDPHSNAMSPDLYEDLRMGTSGEFGGLGIKITTDRRPPCDGELTVVEVFDGTPAAKSGLEVGDQIVKIDGESTVNISTAEAAERLRGKPGTKVRLRVRNPAGRQRQLTVTRRRIPIASVESEMLDEEVGYIRLDAFQGNSAEEFAEALRSLRSSGMKGLIVDLRGNPGGLLDITIEIADRFLSGGTIVATAGRRGTQQDVQNASTSGTEPLYPLVVLVDQRSASAAEILAGALRHHGRALLVGETTFGKGSVQMVLPLPGEGALRLTSAQYLTPGNISIQAVGVAPDVRFVPAVVDRDDPDLMPGGARFSEADLEKHLERPTDRRRSDRPGVVESTLFVPLDEREKDLEAFRRCYTDNPNRMGFADRYETDFAERLIASTSGVAAEELLLAARELVEEESGRQEKLLIRALRRVGIDWGEAPEESESAEEQVEDSDLRAKARLVGRAVPGEKVGLRVEVKNRGKRPVHRLRAVTASDNHQFAGHELLFGRIPPGGGKRWTARIELPLTAEPRVDPVRVDFRSDEGRVPSPVEVDVEVATRKRPQLAFEWHTEDLGDGNGFPEPGEEMRVRVEIENVGDGPTRDAEAKLSSRPGVDVVRGRIPLGRLKPGESEQGSFRYRVGEEFEGREATLRLVVEDLVPTRLGIPVGRSLLDVEIDVPISRARPGPGDASGEVTVTHEQDEVPLREGPSLESRVAGYAEAGAVFEVDARYRGYFRALLDGERSAWIEERHVRPGGGAGKADYRALQVAPPRISMAGDPVRRTSLEELKISGQAEHDQGLRDLMVFVGNHKVAYLPAASEGETRRMDFEVEVPLEVGENRVSVVARHDARIVATESVFVRREEARHHAAGSTSTEDDERLGSAGER
ncbi:MAG: MXAN_5808 family serine peptidase [Polyangia bacterium]